MSECAAVPPQEDPKSWVDGDGQEWCHECKEQVLWFQEGWICSSTCPVYLASETPSGGAP